MKLLLFWEIVIVMINSQLVCLFPSSYLKGHCHAIWQLHKKLEGDLMI